MIYKIKILARRIPFVYKILFIFSHSLDTYHRQIVTKNTDLCIEGYPSSGNTFIYFLIKSLNPSLRIGNLTHSIANVKLALKYNIPCVVLIREPLEAISSRIVRFKQNIVHKKYIEEYIDFYKIVLDSKEKVIVINFNQIKENLTESIRLISKQTNFPFPLNLLEERVNEVKIFLKVRGYEDGNPENISLPNEKRNEMKQKVKQELLTYPSLIEAVNLYNQLSNKK